MSSYKIIIKYLVVLALYFLAARLTHSSVTAIPFFVGVMAAFRRDEPLAFACMALLVMNVTTNPLLVPKGGIVFLISVRIGMMLIALLMVLVSTSGRMNAKLPMGSMLAYLGVAAFSSCFGWVPIISFIKLANFLVIFLAMWTGMGAIGHDQRKLMRLRNMFFALCAFEVLASAALIPFPALSRFSAMVVMGETGSFEDAVAFFEGKSMADSGLFCGFAMQSQALGPLMAMATTFFLLDMYFLVRKVSKVHVILIVLSLFMLYQSGARVGLVAVVGGVGCILFMSMRGLGLSRRIKALMRKTMTIGLILLTILLVVAEARDNSVSRFIRKKADVETDDRSLGEAFTESRQGSIAMNMSDFWLNPIFGMGFQVWEKHTRIPRRGFKSYLSAPIEKGLLPLMVLGETGIVGFLFFSGFVLMFYCGCMKRGYVAAMAMMSVLFVSNLGEATFFSVGATGGVLWLFAAVAGFGLDLLVILQRRMGVR